MPNRRLTLEHGEDYIKDANEAFAEVSGMNDGSRIDLLEVCCPPDSRLTQTVLDHGRQAIRIGLPATDLRTDSGVREVVGMISQYKPRVVWISLPCGPYPFRPCSTKPHLTSERRVGNAKRMRES